MNIITLTSDMGMQDYLVAGIKGCLLPQFPDCQLVDITHQIEPLNLLQAAYVVKNAWKHFPPETFHVLLVDLFYQRYPRYIMAFHEGQYFCGADNGLLPMILDQQPQQILELNHHHPSLQLFDVIQLFAKAIRHLLNGHAINEIGEPLPHVTVLESYQPRLHDEWIEAQIIFIDHYENVIVNLTREQFEAHRKGRKFKICFRHDEYITEIHEQYADVRPGEKLAFFNAGGYLEIAINRGNAAGLLGLQSVRTRPDSHRPPGGMQKNLFYQSIKIIFEP
ncbi:SAM hydrolase/SAM-dependent halogenase family protein [Thermoflavifilum thermophilum]|nr:SAM-dependent chlorinase/fluorinase [Thermoflavifilum thermophilum]